MITVGFSFDRFNVKLPSISVVVPNSLPFSFIVAPISGSLEVLSFTKPLNSNWENAWKENKEKRNIKK
jgi:hypothetical protein